MSVQRAKEFFEDAMNHIDAGADPVMWDMANGLWQLSEAVEQLESIVEQLAQRGGR